MVTVICRNCGEEYGLVYGSPTDLAWCTDECRAEFDDVVDHLVAGGDPAEIDLDPRSHLYLEACKAVAARRRREMVERRDVREAEYGRSRPKKLRAAYPV
jgi:hypothetical protein